MSCRILLVRQGEHHFLATPEDLYRALYFQLPDNTIMRLTTLFEPAETSKHLSNVEIVMIGEFDVSRQFCKEDFVDYIRHASSHCNQSSYVQKY